MTTQSDNSDATHIIPCKGYVVQRNGASLRVARLNLGCGHQLFDKCCNVDIATDVGADVTFDLCARASWPFEDDTFNSVYASHIIEHLRDPLRFMQELARVCAPGAVAIFRLPYGSSDNAWEDPTHVRPYFLDSFGYFSQAAYGGADYGYRGDWTIVDRELKIFSGKGLETLTENLDQVLQIVMTHRNIVEEMKVIVRNVKPPRDPATARERAPISFAFNRPDGTPTPPSAPNPDAH